MRNKANNLRRGVGALPAVIILVFLQFAVVGAIVTGTRDADMVPLRLDTTRAFYATESGFNMSIRETILGVDEDSDGIVGTISNDNNPNNDPALGNARFIVDRSVTGGITTLISTGRCGVARRKVDAKVSPVVGGPTQTVMVGFGRNNSSSPRVATWNGSSWNASTALTAISAEPKWVRMKICPTRNETCMIIESEDDRVNLFIFNGSTWSAPSLASTDTGGTNDRPEDVAYEQLSSDAICVYWKGTSSTFGYRMYNGTSFSSELTLSSPFTTEADFVTLFPRPASDDVVLLAADGIAGGKLSAAIWNGTSWGSWSTLITTLESNNEECYSMAFEAESGRGLAVYTQVGQSAPRYRTLNGSTWSSQSNMPSIGGVGMWLRLAADPTSDQILFVGLDANRDINANVWNGSWGSNIELETNTAVSDRRQFDVLFDRGTGNALLVYAESGQNLFRYRTWNGSSWSSEMSGPNLGAAPQIITLSRGFAENELFVACSDASNRLHLVRWDGTSMSTSTIVENNLSGQVQYYAFAVPEPTPASAPRLEGWAEVTPE